jgi:hypothetical protein
VFITGVIPEKVGSLLFYKFSRIVGLVLVQAC